MTRIRPSRSHAAARLASFVLATSHLTLAQQATPRPTYKPRDSSWDYDDDGGPTTGDYIVTFIAIAIGMLVVACLFRALGHFILQSAVRARTRGLARAQPALAALAPTGEHARPPRPRRAPHDHAAEPSERRRRRNKRSFPACGTRITIVVAPEDNVCALPRILTTAHDPAHDRPLRLNNALRPGVDLRERLHHAHRPRPVAHEWRRSYHRLIAPCSPHPQKSSTRRRRGFWPRTRRARRPPRAGRAAAAAAPSRATCIIPGRSRPSA